MNLSRLFIDTAERRPEQVALRPDETTFSYADVAEASARVAGLLVAQGVRPGDRVALMLPNVPPFAAIYYGVLRAGGVVVPMNPLLKGREIAYHLSDSGARLLFAWETAAEEATAGAAGTEAGVVTVTADGFTALLAAQAPAYDVVDRADDDTAVILYTSGTTGRPKGAELTHLNLIRNVEVSLADLLRLTEDDVIFGGLPMFHAFGQTCALNVAMATGASVLLLPRFDARAAADLLARHHATVFAGVPTMYAALLGLAETPELPDLRVCVSGGAALPVEVLRRFEERFGCAVLEGYGLSETSPVASFNRPDQERRPGSIGTPVTGVQMAIVDGAGTPVTTGEVGEIVIRGHNIMKGYWDKPDATADVLSADGWFRTGDMGRIDEDGFFFVVDRKKDLVIRGGFNVYPREIEEVLYEHPDVAEAAVIGIPHSDLGEEIGAAVALRPGSTVTEDELRAHVKAQVAPYKYPRVVWFVDALPKGPTGKILKREIVAPTTEENAR
ncbi:long-chain-fatty-acid--CoA ligase [Luteipulveratus mongoliensis]|uniref:AMP-dependent synthetase n=1 Tax=Luteipulveratus mongoliensis TaxID=571913 RepID=A0A0K1JLW7_9MICO|nr:long-chain fatty acid--CoA ligase [Luteipulveratus mongoliensis]AKU17588.1 AMP-dependent synthetase [Luteipulveratus mongoliensis]